MSCYGSRINRTPHLDRIADGGMRFDNCFCTNSICTPSRAVILTGTYNHVNGVTTLSSTLDGRQVTMPKLLQDAGYQTAIVGKWHLGHGGVNDPTGFDYWNVLPGQGLYHDPEMIEMGERKVFPGYVTDLITDFSLDWLQERATRSGPSCSCATTRRRIAPGSRTRNMRSCTRMRRSPTRRPSTTTTATAPPQPPPPKMRIDRDMTLTDLKQPTPQGLTAEEEKKWKYQRYIKDYLRCVASIDDNVGRLLDYLEEEGLAENTIVVYTSDQGFFLGDHGWYDKRFMYEESLRMPLLIRYPQAVAAGAVNQQMVLNVDFTPTLLAYAGVEIPAHFQGSSFRSLLAGDTPDDWQTSMYYRYWMHLAHHHVYAHYGVRTLRYKLIYYYADGLDQPGVIDESKEPEWELFDLDSDPSELNNVYHDPAYTDVVKELTGELHRLQAQLGDEPYDHPSAAGTWRR